MCICDVKFTGGTRVQLLPSSSNQFLRAEKLGVGLKPPVSFSVFQPATLQADLFSQAFLLDSV